MVVAFPLESNRPLHEAERKHKQVMTVLITQVFVDAASGGFSDSDLFDVSKDDTYKPDKGKGNRCNFQNKRT